MGGMDFVRKQRKAKFAGMTDQQLLDFIREKLPGPGNPGLPPLPGAAKTINRRALEGVAGWLDGWISSML